VNRKVQQAQVSTMAQEILSYLIEHPKAQDTLDGIIQWWILEQEIKRWVTQVQAALTELVAKKLVIARKSKDGQIHYSLNRRKLAEVRRLLSQEQG
jgi:hypothetical protein